VQGKKMKQKRCHCFTYTKTLVALSAQVNKYSVVAKSAENSCRDCGKGMTILTVDGRRAFGPRPHTSGGGPKLSHICLYDLHFTAGRIKCVRATRSLRAGREILATMYSMLLLANKCHRRALHQCSSWQSTFVLRNYSFGSRKHYSIQIN
jgi:hypothetical protein